MGTLALPSTFFLTILIGIGLFFFIRASAKDRTKVLEFVAEQSEDSLVEALKRYFSDRSYKVTAVEQAGRTVTFEGFVRPSLFLAIFLSFLAAVGIFCLSLVTTMLFPGYGMISLIALLLAPLAGLFYWKKAGRIESVNLQLTESPSEQKSRFTVTAHRDELIALQNALPISLCD